MTKTSACTSGRGPVRPSLLNTGRAADGGPTAGAVAGGGEGEARVQNGSIDADMTGFYEEGNADSEARELSPNPRPWYTVMVFVPRLLIFSRICF